MIVIPFLDTAQILLIQAAPGMPENYWWMTAGILIILGLTATVDAFTASIPDSLIFLGILAVASAQAFSETWQVAAERMGFALASGFAIWTINFIWQNTLQRDALGMGDAKWTMLAVACFGFPPVLFAWGLGAVLASLFIIGMKLFKYEATQVTFAPFLFASLLAGLYGLRFEDWPLLHPLTCLPGS